MESHWLCTILFPNKIYSLTQERSILSSVHYPWTCLLHNNLTAMLFLAIWWLIYPHNSFAQVKTEGGLNASVSFIAKANPLNRPPNKRKSELQHALCNMLSSILAPLAEGGRNYWPPLGVESALSLWYDAVSRIRVQLMYWMDKHSKHIAVSWWHEISFYTYTVQHLHLLKNCISLLLFLNLLALHHFGNLQACLQMFSMLDNFLIMNIMELYVHLLL
jgi:hypothetical protein